MAEPTMLKLTANYRHYNDRRDDGPCGKCSMYVDENKCTLVKGHIYKDGTCDHYEDKR